MPCPAVLTHPARDGRDYWRPGPCSPLGIGNTSWDKVLLFQLCYTRPSSTVLSNISGSSRTLEVLYYGSLLGDSAWGASQASGLTLISLANGKKEFRSRIIQKSQFPSPDLYHGSASCSLYFCTPADYITVTSADSS